MAEGKAALVSPKGAKSPMWRHFGFEVDGQGDKVKGSVVKCRICDREVGYSGNTSNLRQHLAIHHPECLPGSSAMGPASSKQVCIESYSTRPKPMLKRGGKRDKEITGALASFLARDMRPVALVEGEGFVDFMKAVEPTYDIPSRKYLMGELRQLYSATKQVIEGKLRQATSVSITLDFWTSHANDSYLEVTVHFVSPAWILESYVLQTREVREQHTADNIAECIQHIVVEWNLSTMFTGMTTDNARNIVAAARQLPWLRLPCIAHTLQLAVNAGLQISAVQRVTARCRKLVGHFRHSYVAQNALERTQSRLDLPQHKLVQEVATRWNSVYDMIQRLLEQQAAVSAVLLESGKVAHRAMLLTAEEVTDLELIATILQPFQQATTMLSSDKSPSISLVQPVICALRKKALVISEGDPKIVTDVKNAVSAVLDRYFNDPEQELLLSVIASLDPRFKSLKFLPLADRPQVFSKLALMACEVMKENECADVPIPKRLKTGSELLDFSDSSESNGETTQSRASSITEKEISAYKAESEIGQADDPLLWWQANECRFKSLAVLARKWLCLQASSVSAERLFSSAGEVVSRKRASLAPDNVDMLLFLHKNL